ncbi:MAG: anti-sigma factor antagonist [Candidatus Zixiibacteriota bacterium]|nr:MAG: anti-sigma factor antagonist [candidate division Zixibacteria bacterium]HDL04650.1 anti-sigma factor antagonist [candidate division Zixibacteria bacterium]
MKMKDEFRGGVAIISLEGKVIGGNDATMFHGKMHEYINNGFKKVVVNLGRVEWMSSVGMGMLITALAATKNNKGQMKIANITDRIESLLTITRLMSIFDVYDSVDDAVAAFGNKAQVVG